MFNVAQFTIFIFGGKAGLVWGGSRRLTWTAAFAAGLCIHLLPSGMLEGRRA
jgi:hypothetical protein